MTTQPTNRRVAFTLLELLVVLAVLALVAAMASMKLGGVYQRARLKQGVAAVEQFDAWVRRFARSREQPCEIKAAVGTRRLWLEADHAGSDHEPRLALPESVTIARVATAREDRQSGEVAVRFDRGGRGETYAVLLASPGGREQWLVFAGLTGQPVDTQDERRIEELLRGLKTNRFDAD